MASADKPADLAAEDQLRQLLFGQELGLLELLDERVGSDPALRESVRRVLVDALREAGVRDHERLSGVLSPLVLSTLRDEIRNSRDLMVDALYPITGRLVKASVKNSFQDLVEGLNQRLDDSLSVRRWKTRFVARVRGVSEAEILLRDEPPFFIEELILLHRPTGMLITRVGKPMEEDAHIGVSGLEGGVDDELLGSMLSAIISFTKDAFGDEQEGELSTLAFGDSELCLEMSPAVILAVRVRGTRLPGFETALHELFTYLMEQWGDTLRNFDGALSDDQSLKLTGDLRKRFHQLNAARRKKFQPPSHKGTIAMILAGMLLAGWLMASFYQNWERQRALKIAEQVILDNPNLNEYPLRLGYDPRKTLFVEGVVPTEAVLAELKGDLEQSLPDRTVLFRVAASPRGEISALADRIDALVSRTEKMQAENEKQRSLQQNETRKWRQDIHSSLTASIAQTGEARALLERRIKTLEKRIKALESALTAPDRLLTDWASRNVILFNEKTDFAEPRMAEAKLNKLAKLMLGTSPRLIIAVVGYTDRSGNQRLNKRLSHARADSVVERLLTLGVPKDRLLSTGRSSENMVTVGVGAKNPNRRVEFELIE